MLIIHAPANFRLQSTCSVYKGLKLRFSFFVFFCSFFRWNPIPTDARSWRHTVLECCYECQELFRTFASAVEAVCRATLTCWNLAEFYMILCREQSTCNTLAQVIGAKKLQAYHNWMFPMYLVNIFDASCAVTCELSRLEERFFAEIFWELQKVVTNHTKNHKSYSMSTFVKRELWLSK